MVGKLSFAIGVLLVSKTLALTLRTAHPTQQCFGDFVNKNVFEHNRTVYLAGLEHTGHHLWHEFIYPSLEKAGCGKQLLEVQSVIRSVEEKAEGRCDVFLDESNFDNVVHEFIVSRMQIKEGQLGLLASCSYPCGDEVHHPDIDFIARAAEAADVDLRILVAVRRSIPMMHTMTVERAIVLKKNCEALVTQLEGMDPNFYVCAPYTDYEEHDLVARLEEFLGINITKPLQESYSPTDGHDTDTDMSSVASEVRDAIEELQACNLKLKDVANCPGGERESADVWNRIFGAKNLTCSG